MGCVFLFPGMEIPGPLQDHTFKLLQQLQNLLQAFLTEMNLTIIYNQAWYTHNIVLVLQIFEMANIIHMRSNIWAYSCDLLCCHHKIGTHCAGECNQDLNISRFCNALNFLLNTRFYGLPRSGRVIQPKHERSEFMPGWDTVEG